MRQLVEARGRLGQHDPMSTAPSPSTAPGPAAAPLAPHPDRLLPPDPGVRRLARELYESVRDLPIVSPHGHVPPQWLAADIPFADPTSLLISPDHYVTRLLHAQGVDLATLGVGGATLDEAGSREAFRTLCRHWSVYRGTPVRFWLESEFADIFGIDQTPSEANADALYDRIAACLAESEFRPRALWDRFGIEVLATTDDPCDDLAHHEALVGDANWSGRVIPTFRPDRYLEPGMDTWLADLDRLEDASGIGTGTLAGFLAALQDRRQYFIDHGAVSADHSHADARTDILTVEEASRIFARARARKATEAECTALRRHLVSEMARMSCEDGLVMTLHPGVFRNHHSGTVERFGADTGSDVPRRMEFTEALHPLLDRYGTHPNLHLVIFTLDETAFSTQIGPLAGFYPSVFAGAPWWFIDAPEAIRRYRSAVTETAGFAKTSGFIDDTRAFCSIPARHDMSRRLDASFVAGLVADHRLREDEGAEVVHTLVDTNPRKVFKL